MMFLVIVGQVLRSFCALVKLTRAVIIGIYRMATPFLANIRITTYDKTPRFARSPGVIFRNYLPRQLAYLVAVKVTDYAFCRARVDVVAVRSTPSATVYLRASV